jgi:glucose/arabinose dehydrogenase
MEYGNPAWNEPYLINDVGSTFFEEINEGVVGSNYGWPITEGVTTGPRG